MYRAIIADDEPWAIYSLQNLICWEDSGFEICATAQNGIEALEKCMELQPNILISDIRMPGLNGLQLLESVRAQLPSLQVVFVSGYSDFTYVQKAIQLGAADYLLKPVMEDQLIQMLERTEERIQAFRSGSLSDVYFALLDDEIDLSLDALVKQLGSPYTYKNYWIFTHDGSSLELTGHAALSWQKEMCLAELKTGTNKWSVLLGSCGSCPMLINSCDAHQFNCSFSGISSRGDCRTSLSSLYHQSNTAFLSAKFLNAPKPAVFRAASNNQELNHLYRLLESELKTQPSSVCAGLLQGICKLCGTMLLDEIAKVYNRLVVIFHPYSDSAPETRNYQQIAGEFKSLEDLFRFFFDTLNLLDVKNSGQAVPISRILAYIDMHFSEDVRLSDVAEHFHFTANYLSTMFSRNVNMTFTQYVTNKRIGLAKELLSQTDIPIQEIVCRSGYNDYFQFNKMFKRRVGVTPGQYRAINS